MARASVWGKVAACLCLNSVQEPESRPCGTALCGTRVTYKTNLRLRSKSYLVSMAESGPSNLIFNVSCAQEMLYSECSLAGSA